MSVGIQLSKYWQFFRKTNSVISSDKCRDCLKNFIYEFSLFKKNQTLFGSHCADLLLWYVQILLSWVVSIATDEKQSLSFLNSTHYLLEFNNLWGFKKLIATVQKPLSLHVTTTWILLQYYCIITKYISVLFENVHEETIVDLFLMSVSMRKNLKGNHHSFKQSLAGLYSVLSFVTSRCSAVSDHTCKLGNCKWTLSWVSVWMRGSLSP